MAHSINIHASTPTKTSHPPTSSTAILLEGNTADDAGSGASTSVKAILRSSIDVELTYPAFRLPGVMDRHFESNFMYTNAEVDTSRSFRRQFYTTHTPSSTHPTTTSSSFTSIPRRSSLSSTSTSFSSSSNSTTSASEDPPLVMDYLQSYQTHQDTLKSTHRNEDTALIPMGSIGTRMMNVVTSDVASPYTAVRNLMFNNARKANLSRMQRKEATFSSVVDIDNEAFENYVTEDLAGRFGDSEFFSKVMLVIILLNSIMIGIETDHTIKTTYADIFSALDSIFLSIFIIEILFKWYYSFFSFWKSPWNISDVFLVLVALLGPLISFASSSRILKMIRILRAFRSLRSVNAFAGMYTVLQTIFSSIPDMLNIIFLMAIVMFIFSVIGVSLFASYSPTRFGDLGSSMFTLFVIAAQDNWVNIFDELVNNSADYTTVALFMVVYITLGGFVFLNLIVAVVVNNLDQTYDNIKRQLKLKYRQLKSNPMPSTTTTSSSSSQPSQKSSHQANDVARECAALPEGHEGAYQRQIPFEIPMLEDITETKLHKYCLVLMILEENLKEYLKIKEALNEILNEIKLLNQKQSDEEKEAELTADEEEDENPLSLFQSQQSMAADPLSRLIVAQK